LRSELFPLIPLESGGRWQLTYFCLFSEKEELELQLRAIPDVQKRVEELEAVIREREQEQTNDEMGGLLDVDDNAISPKTVQVAG
jgi:hypothetical protein